MSKPPRPAPLHPRNRLLLALDPDELAPLLPLLERVSLKIRDMLYDVDTPIEHVYFPENCVASILGVMADGTSVETATVGFEGMLGLPVFHGTDRTTAQCFCQVAGDALRMTAGAFRGAVSRSPGLSLVLHRYSQALFTLIGQSSACNRVHNMQQRCARWLLHTHDRVGGEEFTLTQQFLAQMLGVPRARVSEAMSTLQAAGSVSYTMGRVQVVDRAGLEGAACECYAIIRREFDRLLGAPDAASRPAPDPVAKVRTRKHNESTLNDPGGETEVDR